MAETKNSDGPPSYDQQEQQQQQPDSGPSPQPAPYPQQAPTAYPQQAPTAYPQQAPTAYPQQAPVTAQPIPQQQQQQQPVMQQGVQWQPLPNQQVVINMPVKFTQYPMNMTCPNCGESVTSVTEKKTGNVTWLTAGALCLFGLACLLCPIGLVAFCIPALKDTIHTCPKCKFTLGKHAHI